MALVNLLERGQLWRGSHVAAVPAEEVEPSGHPVLDELLSGGGWLHGQLIELLYSGEGRGELRLLWPLLKRFSSAGRAVLWIDPPHHPYSLALLQAGISLSTQRIVSTNTRKERLWAIEQALKSGASPLVLSWLDFQVSTSSLRRLQLAAQSGGGLGWVMRSEEVSEHASPAAYRVRLNSSEKGVELTLIKRRGGWPLPPLVVKIPEVV
ncbi:translesion DNA synthesis-associated protein ImuA [Marinobacterium sp. D7]|uniref:translesion DNA synthesis-associated protein ImuA n=1 Tax=Marinobacterium ramblicola TaxID=2849041 RepID=UPI001C2D17EF|nr:translesion DNA synthesis-associated protein ImuA [Marinobacterium ramblicola]MBV1790251.1 translesion DNA synthesis-associated protein ImuA [Marinobacterium ramblicola]